MQTRYVKYYYSVAVGVVFAGRHAGVENRRAGGGDGNAQRGQQGHSVSFAGSILLAAYAA
eukprot:353273-Chlamydomonas_euryale.AAC.15